MSCYCHITPGRLRVKTPIIRQNADEAEKVRGILRAIPGIETVSVNGLTGSITVYHSGSATDSESILRVLKDNGYLMEVSEGRDHPMESLVSGVGATLGKAVLGAVVGKAFEGSMLSFLAFLV
ncbi:MAG: hypothetical protein M0Z81_15045 [Deltaproteobacteria bacterium]|jgi:copper chaperone CopZ|nr:hypothetical protein [Deltaproteobacteria bacterium]